MTSPPPKIDWLQLTFQRRTGADDTIQHRLTQCGASKLIWNWTRERIAAITRTNSLDVPKEWARRPDFHIHRNQVEVTRA